ncbi:hypothetical protein P280DRAFT_61131 [Massarina eburnea CBS 473.64]|uniref:Uncharacterized protein n=1 Tax=Massarina eburnea CBS 473.64 TaxID=1395130 RepID=A0A6A6RZM6_9PLEO|nr:hypothetical protein P280DRAFT_61131 [Massarina eburnea CBS 473.64]
MPACNICQGISTPASVYDLNGQPVQPGQPHPPLIRTASGHLRTPNEHHPLTKSKKRMNETSQSQSRRPSINAIDTIRALAPPDLFAADKADGAHDHVSINPGPLITTNVVEGNWVTLSRHLPRQGGLRRVPRLNFRAGGPGDRGERGVVECELGDGSVDVDVDVDDDDDDEYTSSDTTTMYDDSMLARTPRTASSETLATDAWLGIGGCNPTPVKIARMSGGRPTSTPRVEVEILGVRGDGAEEVVDGEDLWIQVAREMEVRPNRSR